nr:opioid growth factor receptor-related protein [Marinobacter sediminum]
MSDEALESTHDYIQWLFPIPEGNSYNDFAPLLTAEAANWFHRNPELQAQQKKSLDRMVRFFGLKATGSGFEAALHLNGRDHLWLRQFDHNHRRISRIIQSLHLCHQPKLARSFREVVVQVGQRQGDVSDATVGFWRTATEER